MAQPVTEVIDCDVLVVGGGMSGCGAAVEAKYWGKGLKVIMVDKAATERSGATGEGLSAINCYMGMKWGWNRPEDYVEYVRNDMMGIAREDLTYDVARHVDGTVHLFEKWGLPIWKDAEGKPVREGRWQIMIHGEAIKPIIAEATRNALGAEHMYQRVFISHLLTDANDPNRVAGAMGFGVRDNKIYVFKAKAVISAAGGTTALFRPRNVGEGMGRTWYSIFDTGSVYGIMIPIGAEMTQMEHRFVPSRFKDSYGPVGAWSQLFRADLTNAAGENYFVNRLAELKKYDPYGSAVPTPTPLRNHLLWTEIVAGRGPIYLRTPEAIEKLSAGDPQKRQQVIQEAWEDFLDMTISQAVLWAAQNIAPEEKPSEVVLAEPYIMGSHSGEAGAWVSGPEDVAPPEYQWGYSKMTTIRGLFAAGDGVGASPHKFSSGSFTEGRLAGKAAVIFALDHATGASLDQARVEALKQAIWQPFETFERYKGASSNPDVNPHFMSPRQGLFRLQKLMDEYAAGVSTGFTTNEATLLRGLELMGMLKEDLHRLAARDRHELLRGWELVHRAWVGEAHMRHLLHRQETRWPGYYYRTDYPEMDEAHWRVFVNSRYDPQTGAWNVFTKPYIQIFT
jgi:adenylylsulfate reductase, subunit A